jgi:crotonobetainyl-CoA:carnitine CoA-transferase CaiB-like acyl-CoA transferase
MNGVLQGRHGNRDAQMAPQGVYASADDSWVALSIRDDREWQVLVEILGKPDWAADPDLATLAGRRARHDDLDREIGAWVGSRDAAEAVSALQSRRLPAAEALVATKMYGEPQLEARGYYQEMEHPRSGLRRYPTWPMRFSYGPDPSYGSVAPTLGQHNATILHDELGLSEKELEELEAASIIGEKMSV